MSVSLGTSSCSSSSSFETSEGNSGDDIVFSFSVIISSVGNIVSSLEASEGNSGDDILF